MTSDRQATRREVVYYIATTLDGFIARPDGSFTDFPWDQPYLNALMALYPETFPAPMRPGATPAQNRRFDTVLMGRRTYEVGLREGLTSPYPTLRQIVFSSTMQHSPDADVELVASDPTAFVQDLLDEAGADIWICGGSQLATTLYRAGLVDRLIVKVNPILFGEGIPLLGESVRSPTLRLADHTIFESGHALLDYTVPREEAAGH